MANVAAARRPGGRNARVRAQILAATVELVARDGISGFRYEQVAELAGVHRTSVYRNWPDRDELVSEAMLQFGQDAAPIQDSGDIRRDLVTFVVAQAASLVTPTGRALRKILQQAPDSPAIQRVQAAYSNERRAALQQRLDRAVGQGQLPAVDAEFLAHLLSGPVHFHVLWTDRPLTRAYAERIVDVVLTGIRAAAR